MRSEDPNDAYLKLDYANALGFYADLLLNIPDKSLQDWPKALELAQHAVENTERRDLQHLALLAKALRYAKRVPEAAATAEEAAKLLPPEEKRTVKEKQIAENLAFETTQAEKQLKKSK